MLVMFALVRPSTPQERRVLAPNFVLDLIRRGATSSTCSTLDWIESQRRTRGRRMGSGTRSSHFCAIVQSENGARCLLVSLPARLDGNEATTMQSLASSEATAT